MVYGDGAPGGRALQAVDLRVPSGARVALVGPSGAGKSTLLHLLNGTQAPASGRVLVNDQDLASLSRQALRRVRRRIGFMHQGLDLVPTLRVLHNVSAGRIGDWSLLGTIRRMLFPPRREVEAIYAQLNRVGIGDKLYERTDRLSGGERQRVALARVLHQAPTALLADEPVSSVDPARARDTVARLIALSKEEGMTLVVSLHDIDLACEFFDRIVGLRGGRIQFDAPPDALPEGALRLLYELETDA